MMSLRNLIALLGALTAIAVPTLPSAAESTTAERIARARFETFNRHDLEALVALYAPDAVLTSPGFCQDRVGLAGARVPLYFVRLPPYSALRCLAKPRYGSFMTSTADGN
jgi:hypothetical protein